MRVLIAALACWGIACAGGSSSVPATDYRASDAPLFDRTVDVIAEAPIVEGERTAFDYRVARADLIASIRVQSLHAEVVKRREAYRLVVKVKDRLKGQSSKELVLRVSDDEPGYRSVALHEDRLLHEPFIAFVKWEAVEGSSEPVAHWHLSPDSSAVRDKIDYVLRSPAPDPHTEVEVLETR